MTWVIACLSLLALGVEGYRQTISVTNGGEFGDWHPYEGCSSGTYATGIDVRVEPYQGKLSDDSGLNTIRLTCSDGQTVTSGTGFWGDWLGLQSCPPGEYLASFKLRVMPDQGSNSDDWSATGITVGCRKPSGSSKTYFSFTGDYGSYGDQAECDSGSVICGLQTRVESEQGSEVWNDDTALNDVKFGCCTAK